MKPNNKADELQCENGDGSKSCTLLTSKVMNSVVASDYSWAEREGERMRTQTKCREFDKSFASHNSLLYFYNGKEKKSDEFYCCFFRIQFFCIINDVIPLRECRNFHILCQLLLSSNAESIWLLDFFSFNIIIYMHWRVVLLTVCC